MKNLFSAYGQIIYAVVTAVAIGCGLFFLAFHNLDYAGMWYDEAGQFWIAQGQHHYSPIHDTPGGLSAVMEMNRTANLDPGGLSILLHFWVKVSTSMEWLRLAPYLLFVLSLIPLGLLAWGMSSSYAFTLFSISIPLAYGPLINYAFEIRAYSMEAAGIITCTYLLHRVFQNPSETRLLVLGIACGAFMWSRYSFFIFTAAVLFSYCYYVFGARGGKRSLLVNAWALLLPIVLSAGAIYRYSLKTHMGRIAADSAADYVQPWMIKGNAPDVVLDILGRNLLSLEGLPITACVVLFLIVAPIARRRARKLRRASEGASKLWVPPSFKRPDVEDEAWRPLSMRPYYGLIAAAQVLSCGASVVGFYPWDITAKWGVNLNAFSVLAVLFLSHELYRRYQGIRKTRLPAGAEPSLAVRGVPFFGVLFTVLASHYASGYRHYSIEGDYWNLGPQLAYLSAAGPREGSVFATHYEYPTVRYFYEYGPYRNDPLFPEAFQFETAGDFSGKVDLNAAQRGIEYVVSGLSLEDVSKRFPQDELIMAENARGRIIRVAGRVRDQRMLEEGRAQTAEIIRP